MGQAKSDTGIDIKATNLEVNDPVNVVLLLIEGAGCSIVVRDQYNTRPRLTEFR